MIFRANQLTGSYRMANWAFIELTGTKHNVLRIILISKFESHK